MSKELSREELRDGVGRLIGTAILKNDKNYTDDLMKLIDTYTAQKTEMWFQWMINEIGYEKARQYKDIFELQATNPEKGTEE